LGYYSPAKKPEKACCQNPQLVSQLLQGLMVDRVPMKILLVYSEFPDTFWSFKHALRFIHKKAASPPLGLLTMAACQLGIRGIERVHYW
jgi:hypothetical protein